MPRRPPRLEAEDVRATAELARTTSEFLGGARSVGTVLDCIARHKGASAGRRDGAQWGGPTPVQAGAACLAEEAVRDAVKSRLGAACAEAMTVGRKRLHAGHVLTFDAALAEARASGMLDGDDEANVANVSELLRNMRVRSDLKDPRMCSPDAGDARGDAIGALVARMGSKSRVRMASKRRTTTRKQANEDKMLSLFGALAERQAGAGSEDDPLSQLVGIIRQHAKPTREDWNERLSDPTLTVCVRALARTITGDWEACRRVVRLGLIGFVRRIFLSDRAERDTSPMCGTEYPALQLALADLLAEVMLSGAGEAMRRHQKLGLGGGRINVGWSMSSSAGFADRPTSREDQPEVLTQISRNVVQSTLIGEAALASEALVEAVAAAQARYDHALAWAVLSALRRAAEQPMCCQHLLLCGLQPALHRLRALYEACGERLPRPAERPRPRPPPAISPEPPDFPRPVAPALERYTETVKGRWLASSASLPELRGLSGQGRGRAADPAEPAEASAEASAVGSPMWLACEVGDSEDALYRECSRSFFLLRINSLIVRLEKSKVDLVQPLRRSALDRSVES